MSRSEASNRRQLFDPLTATASELQELLRSQKCTSVDMVNVFLDQVKKHDEHLRAVIAIAEDAIKQAENLDAERTAGRVRGPLHGIPILIKDNIATVEPDLDTTAGSFALAGAKSPKNALVIDRLREAGLIILGKAQLSEFAYYKGSSLPCGWSAIRGQGQNPYTSQDVGPEDDPVSHNGPLGSSSGSAVGVAAGYSPLSIGTETMGSIVSPATRASLYAVKPTQNAAQLYGVVPISAALDCVGPMAKDARDIADLLDVMLPDSTHGRSSSYVADLAAEWSDLRVGVLDLTQWSWPDHFPQLEHSAKEQMDKELESAYQLISEHVQAFAVVTLPATSTLSTSDGLGPYDLMDADMRTDLNGYLAELKATKVRTLAEIIQFNLDHPEQELPKGHEDQDRLVRAQYNTMTPTQRQALLEHMRHQSRVEGIDKAMSEHNIDVIICSADSEIAMYTSCSGYPSATLPLSYLKVSGRPFGVVAVASAHGEHTLVKTMSAWEKTFPARKPPASLMQHCSGVLDSQHSRIAETH